MSRRYLGGLLSSSSPAASVASAPGLWTLQQQSIQVGQGAWPIKSAINMEFVASVDFAVTTTSPAGPTVPSYVDNTYLGVLLEYTAAYSTTTAPSGWIKFFTEPDRLSGASLSVYYKILSTSDRGTTPGALTGGNQRDQLYIFKNSLGPITSITQGNFQKSQATGSLSAIAPTIITTQSAIAIHYYYNTSTMTPPLSSSPTMTILRSTVNNYHGGQYIIYNAGQTPVNQTIDATLAGTIRQALLWLIVQ